MEVRYPKFIWAPGGAQLYSLAETPQSPPPRIWAHIRGGRLVSQDRRHLFETPKMRGEQFSEGEAEVHL